MLIYDKQEVKNALTIDKIYELLQEWGAEPEYTDFGILCATICHNPPGEGSKKLYYYDNSGLFRCYTHCGEYFDLFQLVIKIHAIRYSQTLNLNDAVHWIAQKFNILGKLEEQPEDELDDWQYFANYNRIQEINTQNKSILLKEYDSSILTRFNYQIKLVPWLNENISQEVLEHAHIGYYCGLDQITIPHFDADGRFIGLRGRTVVQDDADRYGKYRPMTVNGITYNHPLGLNLYNYNHAKYNIAQWKKAFVYEGEKSVLKAQSYFGFQNDISVACCGSSLSAYQVQLLIDAGATEIIIAFDRQFQAIGDDEFKHLKANLLKLHDKYKSIVNVSFIFDKRMITQYKASPIDEGKDKFLQLYKERIIL